MNAEKRLVSDVLHLESLEAVIGISMGGMQAFDWAVRYPGFARRIIPIVGSPKLSPYDELLWRPPAIRPRGPTSWAWWAPCTSSR